jgi:hypothetical protein
MTASIEELIAKLENLTSSDRVLDAEIACLVTFTKHRPARKGDHADVHGVNPESDHAGYIYTSTGFLMADRYTSRIDDALTLMPSGWEGFIGIGRGVRSHIWRDREKGISAPKGTCGAIALCILALKARLAPPMKKRKR